MAITEQERAALAAEFPGWHIWQWNGLVRARRLRSSPPIALRAATAGELRELIRAKLAERGHGLQPAARAARERRDPGPGPT